MRIDHGSGSVSPHKSINRELLHGSEAVKESGIGKKVEVKLSEEHLEQEAKNVSLRALKALPDYAKTQFEKTEEKKLEKLALTGNNKLDDDQKDMVSRLEAIEREVVMHEMAHQAIGGTAVGPASFIYTLGPNHKYYKTGGSVQYKLPFSGTPESMLKAFEGLKAAAGGSMNASGQDKSMAAFAEVKIREIKDKISNDRGKMAYYAEMLRIKKGSGKLN